MTACEARQIWGKVFPKLNLNDTKSQIRYLRQELKNLGMPSRMSMEAAKKIGARRALEKEAKELGIDLDEEAGPSRNGHESQEELESARSAARPKRAAALRRPPPKQRIKIDSSDDDDLEEADDGSDDSGSEDSDAEGATDHGNGDASSSSESSSGADTDDDDDAKPAKKQSKVCYV